MARVIIYVSGALGPLFFWFTYIICLYWFFFYKGQSILYLVLPWTTGDIAALELGLALVICCEVLIFFSEIVVQWKITNGRPFTSPENLSSSVALIFSLLIGSVQKGESYQQMKKSLLMLQLAFGGVYLWRINGHHYRYTFFWCWKSYRQVPYIQKAESKC